jgi:hypothetical protein
MPVNRDSLGFFLQIYTIYRENLTITTQFIIYNYFIAFL